MRCLSLGIEHALAPSENLYHMHLCRLHPKPIGVAHVVWGSRLETLRMGDGAWASAAARCGLLGRAVEHLWHSMRLGIDNAMIDTVMVLQEIYVIDYET